MRGPLTCQLGTTVHPTPAFVVPHRYRAFSGWPAARAALKVQVEAGGGMADTVRINTYLMDIRHGADHGPIPGSVVRQEDAGPYPRRPREAGRVRISREIEAVAVI